MNFLFTTQMRRIDFDAVEPKMIASPKILNFYILKRDIDPIYRPSYEYTDTTYPKLVANAAL